MAIFSPQAGAPTPVVYLGAYRAYLLHKAMGGNSLNYDRHSGRILDFKAGHPDAIEHFASKIEPLLGTDFSICVVPSHDPAKAAGPLHALAAKLASTSGRVDASACLVRHTLIPKLAKGGNRDKSVHLGSIKVVSAQLVAGRNVLLVDDVSTSGGSIDACMELLGKSGAREVRALCLGQTR